MATPRQQVRSSSGKERGAARSHGRYCQLSTWKSSCYGQAANPSSKANWQLLISLQEAHKMLRLRILSGNSLRARLKAKQVRETHLGRLWFPWDATPNCKMKRKGRVGQNIWEYWRREAGERGLAGNTQHPFGSVTTDDKQKTNQQPKSPSNMKMFLYIDRNKKGPVSLQQSLWVTWVLIFHLLNHWGLSEPSEWPACCRDRFPKDE